MIIEFEKEYLEELYIVGKSQNKKYRFQPQIVKSYIEAINRMILASKVEDLYKINSFNYKKLANSDIESIRINNQYRLEFKSRIDGKVSICNIIELTNHYK